MKADLRRDWLPLGAIALSFVAAVAVYPRVPNPMPTHWNAAGVPDGYGSRFVGVFLLPLISLGLYVLFLVLPRIDPRRANYERFSGTYRFFRELIILFLLFVYGVTLFASFQPGYQMNSAWMFAGVGFLLAALGNYLPRVRSNWFVGIRTPWTLSSEKVWRATHRVGGRIFVVGGVAIAIAGLLMPGWSLAIILAGTTIIAVVPIVYSYVLYTRVKREEGEGDGLPSSEEEGPHL
jgi:uncharacterized membrane protein